MSRIKVDFSEVDDWVKKYKKKDVEKHGRALINEISHRYKTMAAKNTPVVSGTMRKSWEIQKETYKARAFRQTILNEAKSETGSATKAGVMYASFVDEGHRQTPGRFVPAIGKRLVRGWVEGRHIRRIVKNDLEKVLPDLVKKRTEDFLK